MITPQGEYAATADALVQRIVALIPGHPEIMEMGDPWDLFGVEGFNCSDINPSLFQASWALRKAQQIHEANTYDGPSEVDYDAESGAETLDRTMREARRLK